MTVMVDAPLGAKQLRLFNMSDYTDIDMHKLMQLYPTGRKNCSKCGYWKHLYEFHIDYGSTTLRSQCKNCTNRREITGWNTMVSRLRIDDLLKSLPYDRQELARMTGLNEATLRPRDKRTTMRLDTADRILTALGMPDMLNELAPVAA